MKKAFYVQRRIGKRWINTWWTDDDPPDTGTKVTRKPRPVNKKAAALKILKRAQETFPDTDYQLVEER